MKNIKPTYSLVSTLAIVAATTGLAHSAQASISEDAGFKASALPPPRHCLTKASTRLLFPLKPPAARLPQT